MTRLALLLALSGTLFAQKAPAPDPHFNRLHDFEEITSVLKGYAAAYPGLVQLKSLGKSTQGRDIWLLSIHNPKTGPMEGKPAFYADGNIHGNEVQAAETLLYTIHHTLKNYGKLQPITETVDRAVLHFVPSINPDGRAAWFKGPSTSSSYRTTAWPVDDDRDYRLNEDGPVDLDGDGSITQMWKKVQSGLGTHRKDPKDGRIMVPVLPGEMGDYISLGQEGLDQDGDGRAGEDGFGSIDGNRSYGYEWAPRYVQSGATDYPLQIPETRAVSTWALTQPNLVASQFYHNAGRMILRPPGNPEQRAYPPQDVAAFDALGKEGERILPGYRYLVAGPGLYTTYGGSIDQFYGVFGTFPFVMELYGGSPEDLDKDGRTTPEERMRYIDLLTQGRQFSPLKPYQHPQFGEVEIGGMVKDTGRMPEGFMLEEECHRNAAFALHIAYQLPKLSWMEPKVQSLGGNLWRVEVPIRNERTLPSLPAIAVLNKLCRHDLATVQGAKVIASGLVRGAQASLQDRISFQEHRPERLMVPGVPGNGVQILCFMVEGQGEITVTYDSVKAGKLSRKVQLK